MYKALRGHPELFTSFELRSLPTRVTSARPSVRRPLAGARPVRPDARDRSNGSSGSAMLPTRRGPRPETKMRGGRGRGPPQRSGDLCRSSRIASRRSVSLRPGRFRRSCDRTQRSSGGTCSGTPAVVSHDGNVGFLMCRSPISPATIAPGGDRYNVTAPRQNSSTYVFLATVWVLPPDRVPRQPGPESVGVARVVTAPSSTASGAPSRHVTRGWWSATGDGESDQPAIH